MAGSIKLNTLRLSQVNKAKGNDNIGGGGGGGWYSLIFAHTYTIKQKKEKILKLQQDLPAVGCC